MYHRDSVGLYKSGVFRHDRLFATMQVFLPLFCELDTFVLVPLLHYVYVTTKMKREGTHLTPARSCDYCYTLAGASGPGMAASSSLV